MKTIFKLFPLAACALVLGFASCSKDDGEVVSSETNTVLVKVEQPTTKAVGDPVISTTPITLTSGTIYFTTGSGLITACKSSN